MSVYETSESVKAIAPALVKAQATVGGAAKSSENPHFKSKFAPLDEVWKAAKGPLTENELAVTQHPVNGEDGTPGLRTVLWHSSGEWIASTVYCKPDKPGPQALGSGITYLRRYSLQSVLGICPEDDDGEAATHAEELTHDEMDRFEASIHFAETATELRGIGKDIASRNVKGKQREKLMAVYKDREDELAKEVVA
jgi:hypothetical protein